MIKIWGHRGAPAYAPENTLASFKLACEMGADGVECDAQFTKDKQVIILHDSDVYRTCGVHAMLEDLTLEELKKLDASCGMEQYRGEQIPTLQELLDLAREMHFDVNIELKTNFDDPCGLEEAVRDIVAQNGMEDHVIYSGNNHVSLIRMKEVNPSSECNLGFYQRIYRQWDVAKMQGMDGVHPDFRFVDADYVQECQKAGVICRVWAPDEEDDLERMMRLGLDVLTNVPDVAVKVRAGLLKEEKL